MITASLSKASSISRLQRQMSGRLWTSKLMRIWRPNTQPMSGRLGSTPTLSHNRPERAAPEYSYESDMPRVFVYARFRHTVPPMSSGRAIMKKAAMNEERKRPFSKRQGYQTEKEITVRNDAPPFFRNGVLELMTEQSIKPSQLRKIACKIFFLE